jgi:hypothetical protein
LPEPDERSWSLLDWWCGILRLRHFNHKRLFSLALLAWQAR